MKCLIFHCGKFSYKLDYPTPVADQEIQHKEGEFSNSLVIFVAIEKGDSKEKIAEATKEITAIANKVNPDSVVINPFAHLSSSLASPEQAKKLSQKLFEDFRSLIDKEVVYTSFGWYKSFMTDVYGHDSSQIFRDF